MHSSEETGPKGDITSNFDINLVPAPNEDSIPTAGLHTVSICCMLILRALMVWLLLAFWLPYWFSYDYVGPSSSQIAQVIRLSGRNRWVNWLEDVLGQPLNPAETLQRITASSPAKEWARKVHYSARNLRWCLWTPCDFKTIKSSRNRELFFLSYIMKFINKLEIKWVPAWLWSISDEVASLTVDTEEVEYRLAERVIVAVSFNNIDVQDIVITRNIATFTEVLPSSLETPGLKSPSGLLTSSIAAWFIRDDWRSLQIYSIAWKTIARVWE